MCNNLKDAWKFELVESLKAVQIEGKQSNEVVETILDAIKMAFTGKPTALGVLANQANIKQFDLKKIESMKTGKDVSIEVLNQLALPLSSLQKEIFSLIEEIKK